MGRREYIESIMNEENVEEESFDGDFQDEVAKNEQKKYKAFQGKKIDSVNEEMKKYKGRKVDWSKKEEDGENFGEENLVDNEEDISEKSVENSENNEDQEEENIEEEHDENFEEKDDQEYDRENLNKQDEDYLKKISNFTPNEIRKGKNVTNQKNLFEFFINLRISLQKIILNINNLPRGANLSKYIDESNKEILKFTISDLLNLLQLFVTFQRDMITKNNYFEHTLNSINDKSSEIISEMEDILSTISGYKNELKENQGDLKHFSHLIDEIVSILIPFSEKLITISEQILNVWYRKTQVYSYKSSTGNKLMKILSNNFCEHLKSNIKNNYESLRKKTMKKNSESHSHEEVLDESLYNDSEFYNFLLKEFISNKEEFAGAEINSSRMDLTLQYLLNRNKQKSSKGVDTKASKNRKIRFDKHEKLINFMVPMPNHYLNPGRQEIIKSIFGGNKIKRQERYELEDAEDFELI